jgi:GT2 family glycosyltransferase
MLGIIIVNYNDWDNLRNCMQSIVVNMPYRIYIVDNLSKPNIYANELTKLENVTYIQSVINGGYSFGNNLGLTCAVNDGCEYFVISNTDIVFESNSIDNLVYPLINKFCDIVGPRVYLPSGDKQEEILGIRVTPISKIKLIFNSASNGFFFKKFKDKFNNRNRNNLESYDVYGVSGCCFAFNKLTFQNVLPFDENIFLYNEEWLFSEKSFKQNLRTIINNKSNVLHIHGATTKNLKLFSYQCFVKSEYYLLKTLFPKFFILNILIYCLRLPKLIIIYFKERLFYKI